MPSAEPEPDSAFHLRAHRPFALFLVAFVVVRLATAWYVDAYVLLNADFNVINVVELAKSHDLPALDDMESGRFRDVLAYSNLYFLAGWLLDSVGIPARTVAVVHHVLGPPLLAAAVYAAAWVLFGTASVALVAALLISFVDYAWFQVNVGYPLLFNELLYYGDVNQVFAAVLIACLLARRFGLMAAAAVTLSLLNPTYGVNSALLVAAIWLVSRISGERPPGLSRALVAVVAGLAGGAGLVLFTRWVAPADAAVPAAARDLAIRTYGHVAIHSSVPVYYLAGLGALFTALAGAVFIERHRAKDWFAARRPWFERVALVVCGLAAMQGLAAYWLLFLLWPGGLIAASPSKFLMLAAIFACPYVALALVRAVASRAGLAIVVVALVGIALRHSLPGIWIGSVILVVWAAMAARRRQRVITPAAHAWVIAAVLAMELAAATAQPFIDGSIRLALELRDVSLRLRAALPRDAILVPYRMGDASANPLGPFTNLSLRTFSRRGYLAYWSVGRNAYWDSMIRHEAERRAFAAAGTPLWPDILPVLERERREHPFEYYTGVRLVIAPCCDAALGPPIPTRLLRAKTAALADYVARATPTEFARYAARLGGTHLFVSKDPATTPPWGPIIVESPHFVVIPVASP
jgi:hypothetical protein